ncbi:MAG: ferredoxin [Acidimicrobiia bacterium]
MALEVTIDEAACMSARECSFYAPGVFSNDEDNNGIAYVTDVNGEPEDKILEAARRCPNFAISVVKDGEKIA